MINDEEYNQATAAFEVAVRNNKEFVQNYIDQAVALHDQGNYAQAIAYYDMMIQLNPNDPMVLRARGGAYAKQGEYERAAVDLKEAVRLDPNYGDAFIDLAEWPVQMLLRHCYRRRFPSLYRARLLLSIASLRF